MAVESVVHSFVREQRAAYRAIRAAIDAYFLRGEDSPQAVEALGNRIEDILRYAKAVAEVVRLRGGLIDTLKLDDVSEEPGRMCNPLQSSESAIGESISIAGGSVQGSDAGDTISREMNQDAESTPPVEDQQREHVEAFPCGEADRHMSSVRKSVEVVDVSMKRKPLKSLEKGMTINDRLYFRQVLCGGDTDRFKMLIAEMDTAGSLDAAVRILSERCGDACDGESEGVSRFVKLLEQRYSG